MSSSNFLPEDYVAKKAERRTNIICLALFAIVMSGVFGAFLVTNRAWTQVKSEQEMINIRYQEAGQEIEELTELESQRDEMLHKAELIAALVERVPRTILMAELINRMPPQLGLLELEVRSEQLAPHRAAQRSQGQARLAGRRRAQSREQADETLDRIEPPRYRVSLAMVGVAPSNMEVSRYLAELNTYPLLRDVRLVYSEQKEIEGRQMRQFQISMSLAPDADVRHIEPLSKPRGIRNPMLEGTVFYGPNVGSTVGVDPDGRNGQ